LEDVVNKKPPGDGKTVLVVEDGIAIREMVCAMLAQSGYRCLEAADGTEALRVVEEGLEVVHLVLSDMIMPRMSGSELARHLALVRPELPIVLMSGYTDDPLVQEVERQGSGFIAKPFTAAALTAKIKQALDGQGKEYAPQHRRSV
jgi:CheY-like chemotaxis protein